jgi:hypothetical protein
MDEMRAMKGNLERRRGQLCGNVGWENQIWKDGVVLQAAQKSRTSAWRKLMSSSFRCMCIHHFTVIFINITIDQSESINKALFSICSFAVYFILINSMYASIIVETITAYLSGRIVDIVAVKS